MKESLYEIFLKTHLCIRSAIHPDRLEQYAPWSPH